MDETNRDGVVGMTVNASEEECILQEVGVREIEFDLDPNVSMMFPVE